MTPRSELFLHPSVRFSNNNANSASSDGTVWQSPSKKIVDMPNREAPASRETSFVSDFSYQLWTGGSIRNARLYIHRAGSTTEREMFSRDVWWPVSVLLTREESLPPVLPYAKAGLALSHA